MPTPTEAINHLVEQAEQLHIRLNTHREDIDELAKAVTKVAEGVTELTRRIEGLEGKQCNQWVEEAGMVNDLAQRINTLAKTDEFLAERLLSQKRRIEQLEKPLEKEE